VWAVWGSSSVVLSNGSEGANLRACLVRVADLGAPQPFIGVTVELPGYSKTVRNVPQAVKNRVYAEYAITNHSQATYEVDHLVPLELGGSNSIANLFPEAASPRPGYHDKDRLEDKAHDRVCAGARSLRATQRSIATDWTVLYHAYFD
jgi:hypothetical protein